MNFMPEDLSKLFSIKPYSLPKEEKNKILFARLLELTKFHREHCKEYRNFLQMKNFDENKISAPEEIPFFPVRLFKEYELLSVNRAEVFNKNFSGQRNGNVTATNNVEIAWGFLGTSKTANACN